MATRLSMHIRRKPVKNIFWYMSKSFQFELTSNQKGKVTNTTNITTFKGEL